MELKEDEWGISFQSRIGPGWIQPFTDKELVRLAEVGVKNLDVVCPAFVTDNLETLEEMNIRGRETFFSPHTPGPSGGWPGDYFLRRSR